MTMQKLRPDLDIGRNISALRRAAKLTQEQTIAKLQVMGIEISKSSYAKIETNRMNIKVSELVALKRIFGVDFNAFFENLVYKIHRIPYFEWRKSFVPMEGIINQSCWSFQLLP